MAASAMVLAGTGTVLAAGAPADANNSAHILRYDAGAANALATSIQPEDLTLVAGSSLPGPRASNAVSAGLRQPGEAAISQTLDAISSFGADGQPIAAAHDQWLAEHGYGPVNDLTTLAGATAGPTIAINNKGNISATRSTDVIGLQLGVASGTAKVTNSGSIDVTSTNGLADGIFASGYDVVVNNKGSISATGTEWAAGIEAQGYNSAKVTNSGDITATANAGDPVYAYYTDGTKSQYVVGFDDGGRAFGIYATGGDGGVTASNTATGSIDASGAWATGIYAYNNYGTGGATAKNAGHVGVTGYYATGVAATTVLEGSTATASNSGDITVDGQLGATGIDALATGYGAVAKASNSGTVDVYAGNNFYGTAVGVIASGDAGATATNSGTITASTNPSSYYVSPATGLEATTHSGTAKATNSGDITVTGGYGVLASAAYGNASIVNKGDVAVTNGNFGLNADGLYGAKVNNSGTVTMDGDGKYNFAVQATSSGGDVTATNSGTINSGVNGDNKYAFGVLTRARGDGATSRATNSGDITTAGKYSYGVEAVADYGDVVVKNTAAGNITANGYSAAVGVFGVTLGEGTATITNNGSITANGLLGTKYAANAFGVIGRADYGDVAITNKGDVAATNAYGQATGVMGTGASVSISNTAAGSITAAATGAGYAYYGIYPDATGINASGDTVQVTNAGSISATSAYGIAAGIVASGNDVQVDNTGVILATGAAGSDDATTAAIGVYAYSPAGLATVNNGADITASSDTGLADGVFASGYDVSVSNTGNLNAYGLTWAAGIEAQGYNSATVTNDGAINAVANGNAQGGPYGHAYGIYATGGDGGVQVTASGTSTISAVGPFATGIHAYDGGTGTISVDNAGQVVASDTSTVTGVQYYGYATGIDASSNLENANVAITNSGDVSATATFGASGIQVTALGNGAVGSVDNSGTIYASTDPAGKYGTTGISIAAGGDANIVNSGDVVAYGGGFDYGLQAVSFGGDASVDNSGTAIAYASSLPGYGAAYGVLAASSNGIATVDNSGFAGSANSLGLSEGVSADGAYGASASNSGTAYANGKYARGVFVHSSLGDVSADNTGDALGTGKYAYAMGAVADTGNVTITNESTASAETQGGLAIGLFGRARGGGDTSVSNAGDLSASGYGGATIGIYSGADLGNASADNSGTLIADNTGGAAYGVFLTAAAGDASGSNSGSIDASAAYGSALGFNASAGNAVDVTNSGDITVAAASGMADGVFASGYDVVVNNTGSIAATGTEWAAGIEAQGYNSAKVTNSGDITATANAGDPVYAYYTDGTKSQYITGFDNGGRAFGIYATGGDGGVTASNNDSGSIDASGAWATGIYAYNNYGTGGATAKNAGHVGVTGYYATGVAATTVLEGSTATASNSGDITVDGQFSATGVDALATGYGSVAKASNSGTIDVYAGNNFEGAAIGVIASGDSGATATNSGVITASANPYSYYASPATGLEADTHSGTAKATNSGDITVTGGYGVLASAAYGNASIVNKGDVAVTNGNFGLNADGLYGSTINNSGTVTMGGGKYNFAVQATSSGGDVTATNSGTVVSGADTSDKYAFGVLTRARGDGATSKVSNSGDITTTGKYSYGVEAVADYGDVVVSNTAAGNIQSDGAGAALGVFAVTLGDGTATVTNNGSIAANGVEYSANAFGVMGRSDGGNVSITNKGDVSATNAYGQATGVGATAGGAITINNTAAGSITAAATGTGYSYYGIYPDATGISASGDTVKVTNAGSIAASSTYGAAKGVYATGNDVTVTNSGHITATTGTSDAYNAIGVQIGAETSATFKNTGDISTSTADGSGIAVLIESNGSLKFVNSGTLEGAVITHAGDDAFTGLAGSSWSLVNQSTDFGDGADRVNNVAGSTIRLFDGRINLGSGDNSFDNAGTISVHGDSSIDMGGRTLAGSGDGPRGSAVDGGKGPGLALVNDGTIDLSGVGANRLTINGDLAGFGAIRIDQTNVDTLAGKLGTTPDQLLVVQGGVKQGSVQTVDVVYKGLPGVGGSTATTFAQVNGGGGAGAFTGGRVVGADPWNFMTLGVNVGSNVGSQGAPSTYDASVQATGLSDPGSLAASVGAGVQSLMATQIGNYRERMGSVPTQSLGNRVSGYVRSFRSEGGLNATNSTGNFGQGGMLALGQSNSGTEVGMSMAPVQGLNMGLTMGKSYGQQSLTGEGFGMDNLQANTLGVYSTWLSPTGYYVDTSYWAMNYNGRLDAAGSRQPVHGKANAFNVETGYTFNLANGMHLEPQAQYTWTHVDSLGLQGPDASFEAADGNWQRARVGLMAWKAYTGRAGVTWTPYSSLSVVHVSGGKTGYSINNAFNGTLDTAGTSMQLGFGMGMQKKAFSASAGLNWTSGGSTDSFLGGQLLLRYGF